MITYLKIFAAFIGAIIGFFLGKSREQLKEMQQENEQLKINAKIEENNAKAIKNANDLTFNDASKLLRNKRKNSRK